MASAGTLPFKRSLFSQQFPSQVARLPQAEGRGTGQPGSVRAYLLLVVLVNLKEFLGTRSHRLMCTLSPLGLSESAEFD